MTMFTDAQREADSPCGAPAAATFTLALLYVGSRLLFCFPCLVGSRVGQQRHSLRPFSSDDDFIVVLQIRTRHLRAKQDVALTSART